VVVTDVGGNTEVVENGKSGIVVPADDVPALRSAIENMARDEALRTRMGTAARDRIAEHFTLDRTLAEYEKLYAG